MEKIYFAGPSITELEIKTVEDAMRNGWYEHPYDYCEKFQDGFAAFHGRKYGVMTPSCTTAIHLLLTALGISDGDEVIVPDCTWIGSSAGITYLRATPVFCDIDPINWCLDPKSVERSITSRTKAIMAVDLFGNMPDMDALIEISEKYGIPLIEDSAEALGSTYKGQRAGKFGIASAFSFHRTKTLTTGEGGMLLFDDKELCERCKFLRDHGRGPKTKPYFNDAVTYKYMPFNLQAALGYGQLQRIEELIAERQNQMKKYKALLSDMPDIQMNQNPTDGVHGGWMTSVVFGYSYGMKKQEILDKLIEQGVPVRPYFYPLSSLPAYPGMQEKYEKLNTVSYDISSRGINLPCAANLTDEQIEYICDCIQKTFK